ncbi:hypothetical protein, partial [Streptomyces ipomoeae]
MYHPLAETDATPAYEIFNDPATAHGWVNAYDDTVQLDEIVVDDHTVGGSDAVGDPGVPGGSDPSLGHRARPAGGRRATLGRRRARRRRALVAGGVGVAVLAGVTIAGLAGLGSSEREDPNGPASRSSAPAADRSAGTGADPSSSTAESSGTTETARPTTSPGASEAPPSPTAST